jgi:hypothetical protein
MALPWAEQRTLEEERRLGSTLYRRRTDYVREANGATRVHWVVEAHQLGRVKTVGDEQFVVRTDTVDGLQRLLSTHGFEVEGLFGDYDIDRQ